LNVLNPDESNEEGNLLPSALFHNLKPWRTKAYTHWSSRVTAMQWANGTPMHPRIIDNYGIC